MKIIDVSEHNGNIDFKKVKNSGIEGVIIRVGWIGNKNNHTLDKRFKINYNNALKNNLKIGFYVYSYCNELKHCIEGCIWLQRQISDKACNLGVFLDLEDATISKLGIKNLTEQAVYFCKYFHKFELNAGIYASKYWFLHKLDINQLLDYKIWLAEWNGGKNHSLGYKVDLWQYTDKGKVNGINGYVDMNECLCKCNKKSNEEIAKEVIAGKWRKWKRTKRKNNKSRT